MCLKWCWEEKGEDDEVLAKDANVRYNPLKLTLKEPQAAQSACPTFNLISSQTRSSKASIEYMADVFCPESLRNTLIRSPLPFRALRRSEFLFWIAQSGTRASGEQWMVDSETKNLVQTRSDTIDKGT